MLLLIRGTHTKQWLPCNDLTPALYYHSVMIDVDACVILSNTHLWHPAVGLSYWLELEMINGLTMQGVGSERSWSFQVELSLLYFCENFSHCFSTALSHHFAPPQTHTHMYTHMVQFSAIEHISCVSYCAEVCAHIFQHQYGRKLSSLFFFPLVNLNNATLQLLGGGGSPAGSKHWQK